MSKMVYIILWPLLLAGSVVCNDDVGPCFQFHGNSFLNFTPNSLDNSNSIHYSMEIKPARDNDNSLLMSSNGPEDFERLYLRDGKLHYFIFNTEPSGIVAGRYDIPHRIPGNVWTTVHVYRMWPLYNDFVYRTYNQTGIMVTFPTAEYTSLDHENRVGIALNGTVVFGGYRPRGPSALLDFDGQMRNMREEKNNVVFRTPSLNYGSLVDSPCSG